MTTHASTPHASAPNSGRNAGSGESITVGDASRAPAEQTSRRVNLAGFDLDITTLAAATDHIIESARGGRGGWVITPNLDILRRLSRDREFRSLASGATLRLADGMPLVWASRLQRTPLPERVAGSDLIWSLCERGATAGLSFYFLGGNPDAAEAAAATLRGRFNTLNVAGVECPPMGFESDAAYMQSLRERLAASTPDVVFVAVGCPKQERVIAQLRGDFPATWFLGIGVTFSFVAGEIDRAPVWMRKVGLEWTHRLAQEPGRLAKRYLVDGVPFAIRLLAGAAMKGLAARRT